MRWGPAAGAGGPYEFVYRTGCELGAFLVAWSTVVEHAIGSALAARAISINVNSLLSQRTAPGERGNATTNSVIFGREYVFLNCQVS